MIMIIITIVCVSQYIPYTPEVQQARDEFLRFFDLGKTSTPIEARKCNFIFSGF